MVTYDKILQIAKNSDFSKTSSLNSFEKNELIFCLLNSQKSDLNQNEIKETVEKINCQKNAGNEQHNFINQIKPYIFKQDFYGDYENIFEEFSKIGISEENTAILVSSIGEIIDNSFSHNLGQWNNSFGPLVLYLSQQIPDRKEINISICDFGIGFLATLKKNYPQLENEEEAIKFALMPQTTGRINKMGGNGLVYLQKNVFNGFKGNITIRSNNTLVSIKSKETVELISNSIPFDFGTNVFISLNY